MVLFAPSSSDSIRSVLTSQYEEFLPVAGMATTTTVFCNESGEYVVYESDEHGFHNPRGMGTQTGRTLRWVIPIPMECVCFVR